LDQIRALQSQISQAIEQCVQKSMGCQNVAPSEPLTSSKISEVCRQFQEKYPPVKPPCPYPDSVLSALTSSVPDHRWHGLSEEFCRVLSLRSSTENLVVANRFLRWIFVQQYPGASAGGTSTELSEERWFTFARKALADLKYAYVRLPDPTEYLFGIYRESLWMPRTF
jgi:hypothetical protein